jgi:hypothetical protein
LATLIIGGAAYSPAVTERESFSVFVKREWADAWVRVPYLKPLTFGEAAFPSIASARLRWDYGQYVNLWYHAGGTLLPIHLENWIIKIQVHSRYGSYIGFIGVVIGEQMMEEGIDPVSGIPVGVQEIECQDISVMLKRRRVIGTFVGDGENWTYLKRTRPFNRGMSYRQGRVPNRSNTYNEEAGCYMFEEPGTTWSNGRIAEYLLACFQPWFPLGNAAGGVLELTPLWRLSGQTDALLSILGEYQHWGRDVHSCMDQLIDRRRGFGAHVVTDGEGPIYLEVYSLSEFPIRGLDAYVPANPRQGWVPVGGDHHVQASYQITEMRAVDEIVVESDEPIKVMATLGFADGSLEPAWSEESEAAFVAATDDERRADLFDLVYSKFQVPRAFDFSGMIPGVDDLGTVDLEAVGSWWHHDMGFERYLPLEEAGASNTEKQYREPFALIATSERFRDLAVQLGDAALAPYDLAAAQANTEPPITEDEFDDMSASGTSLTADDLAATLSAWPEYYVHLSRTVDLGMSQVTFQPGDTGLGFYVRGENALLFAHNRFFGESERSTLWDYQTLLATLFFRTDETLRVRLPVWTGSYVDQRGRTVGVTNPQGRQIHIVVPAAECWVAAPWTVTDVIDGVLQFHNEGAAEIIRNDVERLRWIALVAYAWYGTPRATCRLDIQNHLPWFRIGDLIKATLSGFWWNRVGTCVTSIEHDCEQCRQVITTAFGEMDPEVMVGEKNQT